MQPILTTKLFIPEISDRVILRLEPLEKMISGFEKNHQLTLICAPAGYGKTTLISEFLKTIHRRTAWISLDDGDNDVQGFMSYLAAAFQQAGVDSGSDLPALISEVSIGNPSVIITILINRIAEYGERVILVLDDYHVIHSQKVNEIMQFMLDHQPPNLHIVIITREDPQLPLSKLRMKGKLTEIRYSELLFTTEETAQFLRQEGNVDFSGQDIIKLTEKTEGWAAGLQLAVLLVKEYREEQADVFLQKFDGTSSYIIDYLVEEVLGHQKPEIREFLCKTSILERMNADLCNELTGSTDSSEILRQVGKKNLFLIPLDYKKEWYRYHHLFADSLRTYLSREEEQTLYRKASVWMKKNGFSQEAVRYAFKSKDQQLIVKMVEDSVEETFQNAQLETLLEWLGKLPEDLVVHNEIFCVRKGIALFIVGKIPEGMEYIASLGPDFMDHASPHNKGLLLTLQAMISNIQGKDAEPLASEALQYLEAWDPIARVSTMNSLGRARFLKGNLHGATDAFEQAYTAGRKLGYQFVTTLALMNYSSCLLAGGRGDIALELCCQYIDDIKLHFTKIPPYIGIIYLVMSEIYESRKVTEKAEYYRETGSALCRSFSYDAEGSIRIYRNMVNTNNKETEITSPDNKAEQDINSTQNGTKSEPVPLEYGETLSEREAEILKLLLGGLSNQEIADTLFITINTTQWHLSHIYSKLGVKSRTQAMIKAKELGIRP